MKKVISIVTPCFNEEAGIRGCYEAIREVFEKHLPDYELEHIFCDNGSTDRTVEILRDLARENSSIKIIINSRNFGILRNTYNGVINTTGDAIILFMPVDLQDPPELIPEFIKLWETGYEIVYGIRAQRQEAFLMRTARKLYYRLLSKLSSVDYPPDVGDFQLIDRKVLETLKRYDVVQPFMRMMTFECGFKSVGLPYKWRARQQGKSQNNIGQLIDQGLLGIVSHSSIPLRMAVFLGLLIALLSFAYVVIVVLMRLILGGYAPEGTFTIVASIFFFGGVQLLFIGLLGEYIAVIFNQVRKQPLVVERERINFD